MVDSRSCADNNTANSFLAVRAKPYRQKPRESRVMMMQMVVVCERCAVCARMRTHAGGGGGGGGALNRRMSSSARSSIDLICPVRNPRPRGEYATMAMPRSRQRGTMSFCATIQCNAAVNIAAAPSGIGSFAIAAIQV